METEANAKVVASVLGADFAQFLAAQAVLFGRFGGNALNNFLSALGL